MAPLLVPYCRRRLTGRVLGNNDVLLKEAARLKELPGLSKLTYDCCCCRIA